VTGVKFYFIVLDLWFYFRSGRSVALF